jgi:hypothetical protein
VHSVSALISDWTLDITREQGAKTSRSRKPRDRADHKNRPCSPTRAIQVASSSAYLLEGSILATRLRARHGDDCKGKRSADRELSVQTKSFAILACIACSPHPSIGKWLTFSKDRVKFWGVVLAPG